MSVESSVPPPSSPPPSSPPAAPAAQKKWLRWLALGCGAFVVFVVAMALIVTFAVKRATAGPEAVVEAFLAAAAAGDYEAAHDHFSAPLQQAQPLDQFRQSAEQNAMFFQVAETHFNNRSVDTTGAKLSGTVTLEAGTEVPASFDLVRENDAWKLIAYQIGS